MLARVLGSWGVLTEAPAPSPMPRALRTSQEDPDGGRNHESHLPSLEGGSPWGNSGGRSPAPWLEGCPTPRSSLELLRPRMSVPAPDGCPGAASLPLCCPKRSGGCEHIKDVGRVMNPLSRRDKTQYN